MKATLNYIYVKEPLAKFRNKKLGTIQLVRSVLIVLRNFVYRINSTTNAMPAT